MESGGDASERIHTRARCRRVVRLTKAMARKVEKKERRRGGGGEITMGWGNGGRAAVA